MAVCVFYAGDSCYDDFEKICETIKKLTESQDIDMFLVGENDGFDAAVRRAFMLCEDELRDISFFVLTASPDGYIDNISSMYVQPSKAEECPPSPEWLKNWLLLQADIIVTLKGFWDDRFVDKKTVEL